MCASFYATCLLSCIPEETIKDGRRGERESKRGRVEQGRESLVKWNLVTDASDGARPQQGRKGGSFMLCMSAWARVNAHARAPHLCAQARVGKGQDMSPHWASGSFAWCDHFTLPPEALFPPKAFSCSWLSTCSECNRERKGWIISTYNSPPKTTVGRKKRGREGEGDTREGFFVLFLFSLPPSPPPVLTG